MKSETLVTTLTSLTTAMAVVAPFVVFGFLYVLQVQPQRAAAIEARSRLEAARYELNRQRLLVAPQSLVTRASALEEFNARTSEGDRVAEVTRALTGVLSSPSVGGVSNLSIETGAAGDGPRDSMVRAFSRPVVHTPITVTFDARYDQVGRFFWSLRVLPTTFDLQSLELAPAPGSQAGLMRARVSLLAFHRPGAAPRATPSQAVDVITTPQWARDPFAGTSRPAAPSRRAANSPAQPAPEVSSILVSTGRRIARVDGRVVRIGDRVRAGVIQAIDADAVWIEGPDGRVRRVALERPAMRVARR